MQKLLPRQQLAMESSTCLISKMASGNYSVSAKLFNSSLPAHDICSVSQGVVLPSLFPWKTIYHHLADNALWIDNWPLKCLLPAEVRDPNRQPKGIADLWGPEIQRLAIALGISGTSRYPLTIHKASSADNKSRFMLVSSNINNNDGCRNT